MKKLKRTLPILLLVWAFLGPEIQAGIPTTFNPQSLIELLEQIRNNPEVTSQDLLARVATWQAPTPTPAPPTSTPTVMMTPTPTEAGPSLPVGLFARVGERTFGFNTGHIETEDVEVLFNSGVYSYRASGTIILEMFGTDLMASVDQFGVRRDITLTSSGNGRYNYVDNTRELDPPNNLLSVREGTLYPQSQWGPFTGFYRGSVTTTDTTSDRDNPCITNDPGRGIDLHILEVDGQIQMLDNSFAFAIKARFDPDNPDSFAVGGGTAAMWDGMSPGANIVGCAPAGTASMHEIQELTLNRDASGANLTGTNYHEIPYTDGTFETKTQSLEATRQNPF